MIDQSDAFGFLEAPAGTYLGDPALVDRLVREFLAGVFTLRAKWHETGEDPTEAIDAASQRAGDIIMGRVPEFQPQPYNCVPRLGVLIRHHLKVPGSVDPGFGVFDWLARSAVGSAIMIEEGEEAEDVKEDLERNVQKIVGLLVGTHGQAPA